MGHRLLAVFALLAVGLLFVSGCRGSCSGSVASGRKIEVTSDTVTLRADYGKDTAKISLGARTLVVEPARVLLEGKEVATIDAASRKVTVSCEQGEIVVVADGKTVYDSSTQR